MRQPRPSPEPPALRAFISCSQSSLPGSPPRPRGNTTATSRGRGPTVPLGLRGPESRVCLSACGRAGPSFKGHKLPADVTGSGGGLGSDPYSHTRVPGVAWILPAVSERAGAAGCACAPSPTYTQLREDPASNKHVPRAMPSVSRATLAPLRQSRAQPGSFLVPPAMAAAGPSVFLLMVNGQVESAQVSGCRPCRACTPGFPGGSLRSPEEACHSSVMAGEGLARSCWESSTTICGCGNRPREIELVPRSRSAKPVAPDSDRAHFIESQGA